jgi:hypothetical protein
MKNFTRWITRFEHYRQFRTGDDIDLALAGEGITNIDISRIRFLLEHESPTLLGFDVLHYDTLNSTTLKQQVDIYRKTIYTR